jgi:hypothetical protein
LRGSGWDRKEVPCAADGGLDVFLREIWGDQGGGAACFCGVRRHFVRMYGDEVRRGEVYRVED